MEVVAHIFISPVRAPETPDNYDKLTASVAKVPFARLVIFYELRLTLEVGAVIELRLVVAK